MSIIGWIILGAIAGWLASQVSSGRGLGCFGDTVVGIIGGLIGGFVFGIIGGAGVTGFNLWSLLVAFIGALILLALVRVLRNI